MLVKLIFSIMPCIHADHCEEVDIEFVPEGQETQPDSPLEDTVSTELKRQNSIRRSRRSRLELHQAPRHSHVEVN